MILKFKDLSRLRQNLHNKTIVLAIGVFDLLHQGHIEYLKRLRRIGDVVVIGVCSNNAVSRRRGKLRPILHERERLLLIDSIRYVDYAFIARSPKSRNQGLSRMILSELRPDIFVVFNKKRWLAHRTVVESYGAKLKIISDKKINSTTRIILKISKLYGRGEEKIGIR